jgi:hypothetical protein
MKHNMRQAREAVACVKCMAEGAGWREGKCQWGGGGYLACHKKLGVEVALEVALEVAHSLDRNA